MFGFCDLLIFVVACATVVAVVKIVKRQPTRFETEITKLPRRDIMPERVGFGAGWSVLYPAGQTNGTDNFVIAEEAMTFIKNWIGAPKP